MKTSKIYRTMIVIIAIYINYLLKWCITIPNNDPVTLYQEYMKKNAR